MGGGVASSGADTTAAVVVNYQVVLTLATVCMLVAVKGTQITQPRTPKNLRCRSVSCLATMQL